MTLAQQAAFAAAVALYKAQQQMQRAVDDMMRRLAPTPAQREAVSRAHAVHEDALLTFMGAMQDYETDHQRRTARGDDDAEC